MSRTVARPAAKLSAEKQSTKHASKSPPARQVVKPVGKTASPVGKTAGSDKRRAVKPAAKEVRQTHETAPARETAPNENAMAAAERMLDLLDALSRLGPVSQTVLERETRCNSATASRLLGALKARGFAVDGQADGAWQLGPRWDVLKRAAHSQGALAAASMPFLAALGKATGENIYLRVRDGLEAETIAVYQTDPTLRVYTETGKRGPLHAGPSRLLLAHAPESVQTQVLSQRLQRFTPATRTDPTWIAADLQRLRMRGYMITADEVNAGAASVSVPVRDASGQVIAVLILSAPSMRLRPPRPRQLLPLVMDAAAQLTRALGGHASPVMVPATNGGSYADVRSAASVPTSPPSPAAWMR
jgi:IclR family KDG regulon transcriptional repressor